jgi:hypothetical protein
MNQEFSAHHSKVETDRVYRNIKDWVTIDELGIEVHFVKEAMVLSDDSRSSEKFMLGIKVLMAKTYIDKLGEEVRKSDSPNLKSPNHQTIGRWAISHLAIYSQRSATVGSTFAARAAGQ